jgi:hypothetical protein
VHHVLVDPPLEQVGEHEHRHDEQPLPGRALQARHAPPDHRDPDHVDDADVERSAVERVDLGLVLRAELALTLAHCVAFGEDLSETGHVH